MQTLKADPAIATHVRRLGGRVVAEGAPEAVARARGSYTGEALLEVLTR